MTVSRSGPVLRPIRHLQRPQDIRHRHTRMHGPGVLDQRRQHCGGGLPVVAPRAVLAERAAQPLADLGEPDVLPPALEPLALQPLGAGDRVVLEWTGPVTVLLAVVAVPALVLGPHVAGTRDVVLADVHVHPLAAAWTP